MSRSTVRRFLVQSEADLYARAVHCVVRLGLARGDRALDRGRDLLQEACAEALRTAGDFDPARGSLSFWLGTLLWERARHHLVGSVTASDAHRC